MTPATVVVINYNYERFVATAIESALAQTHRDVQVVVVDDASTDDSRAVIESFGGAVVPVFHTANRGQGAVVNSGAAVATGELVWFLDADDALLPGAVEAAITAYETDPSIGKFHAALAVVDRGGRPSGGLLPADPTVLAVGDIAAHVLRYRNHGWPPMSGNAYPSSTLDRILPVPEDRYREAADSFLNEQAAICGPLARSLQPLAIYRVHGENQYAGRPVTVDWLRTKLGRELCSHDRLGPLAESLGLSGFEADPAAARDVALLGYRLASLRLDPGGHPVIAAPAGFAATEAGGKQGRPDTRLRLAAAGIAAAATNRNMPVLDRLTRSAWFAAAASLPSGSVPALLSQYMPDGPSPPIWRRRRPGRTGRQAPMTPAPLVGPPTEEHSMTETHDGEQAQVTIVVTPRERFGLSRAALESIYEHTKVPFELVYVDGRSPRRIGRYLEEAAAKHGFTLIRSSNHLSPNQARNLGLAEVTTPFVAFVDNDLIVTDGWLDTLLRCADETDAWLVGPLYFEGEPGHRIVHMAGGDYALDGASGERSFTTVHRLQGSKLDDVEQDSPLTREAVDFVEFHCMLARTDVLHKVGGLDERLLSTREHLDLCMAVTDHGGEVYFEPSSRVTYLTPPPVDLGDVPYYWRRWSESWNEASLDHFCAKHGIAPAYSGRIVGMRARRQILLEPVRKVSAKLLPDAVDRFAMRVLARLEREANRAVFRPPEHAG